MKYTCLNPIASVGLEQFTEGYEKTEKMEDADAVLVRSAAMQLVTPRAVAMAVRIEMAV